MLNIPVAEMVPDVLVKNFGCIIETIALKILAALAHCSVKAGNDIHVIGSEIVRIEIFQGYPPSTDIHPGFFF